MEIRFTMTPRLLYDAQRAVARRVAWMRWAGALVVVGYPLVIIALTLAYGGTVLGAVRSNWVSMLGLPFLWVVAMPLLQRWLAGRTLRSTPALQGEQLYRVGPAGVRMENRVSATDIRWDAVVRAAESPDFFLLFQSAGMALFIPKIAFASDTDVEAFRRIVADGVGARATWSARAPRGVAAT